MNEKIEEIRFKTSGTCSRMIIVRVKDNVIEDAEFIGGCPGNLQGISKLIKGCKIDEIIEKLQGIKCGDKSTSCPDQLAKCLTEYKLKTAGITV